MYEFKFDLPKECILTVPSTFCEDDASFNGNFDSGIDGASAYQIAVAHGFRGTEEEWLSSLKGEPFKYEDFTKEQLEALRGPQGIQGIQGVRGEQGEQGERGDPGPVGATGPEGPQGPAGADGAPGKDGQPGRDGVDGKDGADGFSPSVAVSDIDGGHRVTITDKDGAKAFDVMDGEGGSGVGKIDPSSGKGEIFNDYTNNAAWGAYSHAEGSWNIASRSASHAEGHSTRAWGESSHAEGRGTKAEGFASHAEGCDSHATGRSQHVQGEFNVVDPNIGTSYGGSEQKVRGKYAHIVGNGTADDARSNAHTLDWYGLGWFAGGLKVGGTGQDDPSAEEIPTKNQVQKMVDDALAEVPTGDVHWDDVQDKPVVMVGGSDTLTWDGNTEGLLKVDVPNFGTFYKVSDVALSKEDVYFENVTGEQPVARVNPQNYEWWDRGEVLAMTDDILRYEAGEGVDISGYNYEYPLVIYANGVIGVFEDNVKIGWFDFPRKGVYFAADTRSFWLANCTKFYAQEKIAPSHLYQPDWEQKDETAPDFVKNKPVVREKVTVNEPLNLQWDGNAEGLLDAGDGWYKVSDYVFSDEDIKKMTIDWGTLDPDGWRIVEKFDQYWNAIVDMGAATEDWVTFHNEFCVSFIRKANTTVDWCGIEFPEPGVYFYLDSSMRTYSLTSEEPVSQTKMVEHIDVNYLPEPLQFGEEVVTTVEPLNIQWDGNTEGLLEVVSHSNENHKWYKVSSIVLTGDNLGAVIAVTSGSISSCGHYDIGFEYGWNNDSHLVFDTWDDPWAVLILKPNAEFGDNAELLANMTFPEVGLYFFKTNDDYTASLYSKTPVTQTQSTIKPIESKYLPMDDITAAILSALPIYNGEVEEV